MIGYDNVYTVYARSSAIAVIADRTTCRRTVSDRSSETVVQCSSPVHQPWESQCTASQTDGQTDGRQDDANSRDIWRTIFGILLSFTIG